MKKLLLVTGSRSISEAGLAYARKAVQRAHDLDYDVIVGDASGIDDAVMRECDKLGVACTVVGAYDKLRRRTASCSVYAVSGSYIQRDKYMAERCDLCLAVWNGKSRGTKATYDFAVELSKTAWLKTFHSEDSRGERPANSLEGKNMRTVQIWTDGSGDGGRGPGGWACILRCGSWEREIRGHELDTTSQRMEIMATIRGLEALKEPCAVTVHTDSQYVIGVMNGWKRKQNLDLLQQLDVLCQTHDVRFEKIRAHSGDKFNERVDQLAGWSLSDARNLANGICHGCGLPLDHCTCNYDHDAPTLPRFVSYCEQNEMTYEEATMLRAEQ